MSAVKPEETGTMLVGITPGSQHAVSPQKSNCEERMILLDILQKFLQIIQVNSQSSQ